MLILKLAFVALIVCAWLPVSSSAGPAGLRVVRADAHGVTLEVVTPPVRVAPVAGTAYQVVSIPSWAQTTEPGRPQTPTIGGLLALPEGATAHVEILAVEQETRPSGPILPAPRPQMEVAGRPGDVCWDYTPDPAVYAADTLWPPHLVELGPDARLRSHHVVPLRVCPVQVRPARGELLITRRLLVRVTFQGGDGWGERTSVPVGPLDAVIHRAILNGAQIPSPQPQASLTFDATRNTPALKITIAADGVYQLTRADLLAAGWDPAGQDPRHFQITHCDQPVPILVSGEADGDLGDGDTILFYGQAMTGAFTTRNVYWLSVGDSPGLRMAERDGRPVHGYPLATVFTATLHAEENQVYWQNPPNGAGHDHWFWKLLAAPASADLPFTLTNLAPAGDAAVRVLLRGKTNDPAAPDHHTRLRLNGALIDDQFWDGDGEYWHTVVVSDSLLQAGANTLTVESVSTAAAVNSLYVNWLEVEAHHTHTAVSDALDFYAPGPGAYRFDVTGFTTSTLDLWDITDAARPTRIVSATAIPTGLRFEDTTVARQRYVALAPAQRRAPAALTLDEPSNWRSPAHGADYIVITHPDFYTAAQPLVAWRQAQGWRAALVKVTDVYDEFSGGVFDPTAIRDFLRYAYESWTPPKPSYVLLVGDANMDYQDHFGTGTPNWVPAHVFETWPIGETPGDNWFACVDGDDALPDLALGRFPVRTAAEAQALVSKTLAYEGGSPPGDWTSRALFVADDDDLAFEAVSEDLLGRLPTVYTATRVYARQYAAPANPATDIRNAIHAGVGLVNYTGHGSVDNWGAWAGGRIWASTDVAELTNGGKLPFVTTATCINGFFAHPLDPRCLAEEFLLCAGGGAVGVWAPTGLGTPAEHQVLFGHLYDAWFVDGVTRAGDATTLAKWRTAGGVSYWDEILNTYTLFGDPATPVRLAPTYRLFLPLVMREYG